MHVLPWSGRHRRDHAHKLFAGCISGCDRPLSVKHRLRGLSQLISQLFWLSVAIPLGLAQGTSIPFSREGKTLFRWNATSLKTIEVDDPYGQGRVKFLGRPFRELLALAFGPDWASDPEAEILFVCADGYRNSLPVSQFIKHEAWLVTKKENGAFRGGRAGAKTIDYSPSYLVWENLSDLEMKAQGDHGWPYQVVSLEWVKFEERFPGLRPAGDSSENVKTGFKVYREYCLSCHSLSGVGGKVGPELGYPKNVTEYFDPQTLALWIDNPAKVRLDPKMPPLPATVPNRAQAIQDVIAYLSWAAKHKKVPR